MLVLWPQVCVPHASIFTRVTLCWRYLSDLHGMCGCSAGWPVGYEFVFISSVLLLRVKYHFCICFENVFWKKKSCFRWIVFHVKLMAEPLTISGGRYEFLKKLGDPHIIMWTRSRASRSVYMYQEEVVNSFWSINFYRSRKNRNFFPI